MLEREQPNLITLKIPYTLGSESDYLYVGGIVHQYNCVLRYSYNRVTENPSISTRDMTALQHGLHNVELIGSHLKNSALQDTKAVYASYMERKHDNPNAKPVIFGARKNAILRAKGKITREEYLERREVPLLSVGEGNQRGNRLFQVLDTNTILFKSSRNNHIHLHIKPSRNQRKQLACIIKLQEAKSVPITYKLDSNYVYIAFDYNQYKTHNYPTKTYRVMAIDLNPNSVGWSVVDWNDLDEYDYRIVASGVISTKPLNDTEAGLHVASDSKEAKYFTNKRKHEVIHIAKDLFAICKHYHCEVFALEDLAMDKVDKHSSKYDRQTRRLINQQWGRGLLVQQLTKHLNASSTHIQTVKPEWSSVLGNIINREIRLPDPVLASIEIGRRGMEFSSQYKFNRRHKVKNVIFPTFEAIKQRVYQSLEELIYPHSSVFVDNVVDLCACVKKWYAERYRFPMPNEERNYFSSDGVPFTSKFHTKKYTICYNFI